MRDSQAAADSFLGGGRCCGGPLGRGRMGGARRTRRVAPKVVA